MPHRRLQLSLHVPAGQAEALEAVRRVVDPVQHRLIPAHVTLCREDELGDEGALRRRLGGLPLGALTLAFGPVEPSEGHGLLLRCVEGVDAFRSLREQVMGSTEVRALGAHLTLAHPRNPRAPGNSGEAAAGLPTPLRLTFTSVCLIEQLGDEPWRVLERYPLGASSA